MTAHPSEGLGRLFSDLAETPGLALRRHRDFVIGRLLENGDGGDLAWLASELPEEHWADWLGARGGRQLSRRSRAFWSLLLDRETPKPLEVTGELWLL